MEKGASSILITEPAHLLSSPDFPKYWKESFCQLFYETFELSSSLIVPDAVLASFSGCFETSLIVD